MIDKLLGLEGGDELFRRHVDDERLNFTSPTARYFAEQLVPRLASNCDIRSQVPLDTPWESFVVAFVLSCNGRTIGIECDGDENSRSNSGRDELRDALILTTGVLDVVYRVPGGLIWHYPHDGLYILSTIEPQFFSARAVLHLERLCTERRDPEDDNVDSDMPGVWLKIKEGRLGFRLTYEGVEDEDGLRSFLLTRNRLYTEAGHPTFLVKLAEFASQHRGSSLRELEEISNEHLDL